jgi:predicted dehydrogenase
LIAETAVHLIDVFRFLAGEITGVFARLHRLNPVIAGEDTGQVLFQFASGTTGLFDGNRLAGHSAANQQLTMGTMEIEGELGMLRLDGDGRWWFAAPGTGQVEHAYPWPREHPRGDYVRLLQAHVIEHMVSGSAIENTGRAYLRNMEVVEAIYRSDREGRWIDLD